MRVNTVLHHGDYYRPRNAITQNINSTKIQFIIRFFGAFNPPPEKNSQNLTISKFALFVSAAFVFSYL